MVDKIPGFAVISSIAQDQLQAAMRAHLVARGVSGPVFYSTMEVGGGWLIVAGRPVEREGGPGGYCASGLAHGEDIQFAMHDEAGIDMDSICRHWGILTYRPAVTPDFQAGMSGRLQWRPPKQGPG